ncbi:MAG: sulfatase [Phycisphaerales bacterium]|jgi:iduronate 2-sulfatase|nr:sulfatase [Phycisphaerales bacterium]MBT7170608.1 sulfatase [Phycisphaerales bacterium]
MNRRKFLSAAALGGVAISLTSPTRLLAETKPAKRPNVLFIISDDLTCALSGYGRRQCKTPHLDRLAKQGMQFNRAYTMNPVCGPARAAIMSGLSPWTTGVMGNYHNGPHGDKLRARVKNLVTLPQFLKANGYHAARVSKIYHMGIPGEIIDGTARADDKKSWDVAINVKAKEQNTPGKKEDCSPNMTHQGCDFVRVEADGPDNLHADVMATDLALEMMPKLGKDKPFFLGVGLVRPHVPLVAPKRFFEPFPSKSMILAKAVKDDLKDVPPHALAMKNFPRYGMSVEQQKKSLSAYYASVSFMDAQVGRLLDGLKENGLEDNTIVLFMSDHGWNLGEHDCWQKQSLWEDVIRTPLIISAPGMKAAGKQCDRIVEHTDIYPTLVELCGFTPPEILPGQSMTALLDDPASKAWNDKPAYTVTQRGAGESLRTDNWHLNLWYDGKKGTELYDVKADPGEFTNLAKDPKHAETVKQLSATLRKIRAKFNGKIPAVRPPKREKKSPKKSPKKPAKK